jgi:hypothetical protein
VTKAPSCPLDLSGAWSKVVRGKMHVEVLRAMIRRAGRPNPNVIPLRREFDPKERAIIFRIEKIVEVGDDWGLIAGDAIHNLRSALDHLAWQLALRYFNGVEPQKPGIVKNIQFPIVSDVSKWAGSPHRINVTPADVLKLEKVQPFYVTHPVGRHFLEGLAEFSNADKHRTVQLAYTAVGDVTIVGPARSDFTDCVPAIITRNGGIIAQTRKAGKSPKSGDEVARFPVWPTGPKPDVKAEVRATGFVGVRDNWDILHTLDYFADGVVEILRYFGPGP